MIPQVFYKSHIEPYSQDTFSLTLCGSMRKNLQLFEQVKKICSNSVLTILSPKLGKKISENDWFVITQHDIPTLSRLELEHWHMKYMIESDIILMLNTWWFLWKSAFAEALFADYYKKCILFLEKPHNDEEILIKDIYTQNIYQKYLDMHDTLEDKIWEIRRIQHNRLKDSYWTLYSDS